jgi:L,D-transpeptidase catalytic domain/Putative peptidoglycan binding domain
MTKRRIFGISSLLIFVLLSYLPEAVAGGNGSARTDEAVTLTANRTKVRFGQTTKLSGAIDPMAAAQTVQIVDAAGVVMAEAVTDESGAYEATLKPRKNVTLHAQWSTAISNPLTVKVRPRIKVKLRKVELFGGARIRGNVRPAIPGRKIQIKLLRFGHTDETRWVRLRSGRYFKTRLVVERPGAHRAKAILKSPDHLRAVAHTGPHGTTLPALDVGARSEAVKRLEGRLIDLGYYLPASDFYYDIKTADAVRAFNKIQRRARLGSVDAATWRKLARPVIPKPRYKGPNYHIEIDQTRQVVMTVKDGKVTHVLHTSTGAGGATRDGTWMVHRKVAGTSGGGLYYPSYFDGLRAIHGWPEVPTYAASHGCSRVPMWAATWIFSQAPLGTRVYVYH